MDATTSSFGTISLQDQSFLYILSRVECYPVAYLAMLPKTWRERLLRAVPPFQLYKLAKTDVAMGIDVEDIWRDMATLKDSIWATYFATSREEGELLTLSSTDGNESMTTRFFNYISHLYFMEQNRPYACHRMRELLFSVHRDNLDALVVNKLLKSHIQSHFMYSPPYYLAPFRCPSYSESKITQMMVDLGAFPRSMEVNMKCVPRCTFRETETSIRLLSSLRNVRVYCSSNDREIYRILKQIVGYRRNSLTTYGVIIDSSLESLELLNCSQYTVQVITPLFSPPRGYNHLRCLHISMQFPSECMRYLPGIIKNQMNTLQELKLTKFDLSFSAGIIGTSDYTLNITLSQLILRPQFRKLILDDFRRLPLMFVVNMIQSFLRSIPNHKQTICFRKSQICQAGRVPFKVKSSHSGTNTEDCEERNLDTVFYPACTEECINYKHLILDDILLPVEFLEWMCNIESLYLNTLILRNISLLPKLPPRNGCVNNDFHPGIQDCDPRQMFDNHPNMMCGTFMYHPKRVWSIATKTM